MWLSEKAAMGTRSEEAALDIGVVTKGGMRPSVMLEGEKRSVETVIAAGARYCPKAGEQVLVARCGGEYFAVATVSAASPGDLGSQEIMIETGAASIHIMPGGDINLAGEVNVEGNLYLNGINILEYMVL